MNKRKSKRLPKGTELLEVSAIKEKKNDLIFYKNYYGLIKTWKNKNTFRS